MEIIYQLDKVYLLASALAELFRSFVKTGDKMGETGEKLHQIKKIMKVRSESGLEEIYYPVFYDGLPEEFKRIAEQELGETSSKQENGLRILKEFMKKENLTATDDLLITVLRSCKYNFQKSGPKLKNFLKSRQVFIDKLRRIDEKKIELILRDTFMTVFPYRDKYGRAIILSKPTISFDKYTMDDAEPVVAAFFLHLLTFPMTNVCGFTYIAEANCDSLFVVRIAKSLKSFIHYATMFPVRIARIDIIYETFILRCFYNAISPLLPEKFKKRLRFHGDSSEDLPKIYHPDILPQDLNGNLGHVSDEFYRERLMTFMRTLKEEALED